MELKRLEWGYDVGGIPGDVGDGYLNVELELKEEGQTSYLWMSRSWDYETVMIGDRPMFSIAMHMTHYNADFELEMGYLEETAKEQYEYSPLEFPENELKRSRFYQEILFAREALNRYVDLTEDERECLVKAVAGHRCEKQLLYEMKNTKKE